MMNNQTPSETLSGLNPLISPGLGDERIFQWAFSIPDTKNLSCRFSTGLT
jgi:hypothetical protein